MQMLIRARAEVRAALKATATTSFREFDGGHGAPRPIVQEGIEWFLGRPPAV